MAGPDVAVKMVEQLARAERVPCDASALTLSLKCGGSDYTSGLASNPALGLVADRLVDLGGRAVLGEVAEIMGAEHLLAARAPKAVPQVVTASPVLGAALLGLDGLGATMAAQTRVRRYYEA